MFFRIDLKVFLFLIIFYFTRQIEIYLIIMIFALLHELAHLFVGIMLGLKIKGITIMPVGFSIEFNINQNAYNKKILNSNMMEVKKLIIALAGPIFNIIVSIIVGFIKTKNNFIMEIMYSNILIAIFNLLPIYPLDGGRILKSLFCLFINRKKSIIYTNKISNLALFFITFIFSILIYDLKNISIIFILIYLWYTVLKENKVYKMKIKLYELLEN